MQTRAILALGAIAGLSLAPNGRAAVFETKTDSGSVARLRKGVRHVMSLSERDMLALVPAQSGIYFTDCPNCDKGTQDRGDFEWAPEEPTAIVCNGCGAKYPGNPDHPDDKVLEVPGPNGVHAYPYHERPDGYRIFLRAHADYWAREHMAERCEMLAQLWRATGEEDCARRAALILLRFAEVYPGYAYHMDLPFRQKRFSPWTKNRVKGAGRYRTAKWDWWAYMDVSLELLRAYDCLREWPGLATMADGKAVAMIENDLFGHMVEFALGFREPYSNMSPVLWRSVIYAGRVLGRPRYVQEAVRRFNHFTRAQFLHDGHWQETAPSYCSQVCGLLTSVGRALEGCTEEEAGGLDAAAAAAAVDDILYSLNAPRFPNGRLIPVNDTWSTNRGRRRTNTTPVLMPGLGVAVLGGGKGEGQLHAHLNFTSGRGHKHRDALSFGLFAFDRELLPDVGYTHTKYRAWALATMSHNTVVVDGADSGYDLERTGNRLRAFTTDGSSFHLVEAESHTAYPGVTKRYRRTLVAIGADARDAYVVDVFQVEGGKQHDYLLHGSADEDSTARISGATLHPFEGTLLNPGVEFVAPKGESSGVGREGAYGFVHSLSSGPAEGAVALEMRLSATPQTGTRTLLLTEPGTTVYLGQAPTIRRAGRNDSMLDRYQAPFFCARRTGDELRSVFVAVHEPLNGEPKVRSASVARSAPGVVIRVERADGLVDHVAMAFEPSGIVREGPLSLTGRYGFVRTRGERVVEARMVGGAHLAFGGFRVKGASGWSGKIAKAVRERGKGTRGWFEVAEALAPRSIALPQALIVQHPDATQHAYNVVRVERSGEVCRLYVREDPAFEIAADGMTNFVCHPCRKIQGATHAYELLHAVHVTKRDG